MEGFERRYDSEEILRKIEELGKETPWFHCVDLGRGINTMEERVPHLQNLWDRISKYIPNDLSGKSVLDIGCNAGFFSVQCKKKRADYVLGLDLSDGFLKQAEFVRDMLNLDIEYKKMSVFEVPQLGRKFDIVFCLGVIYHCADPFSVARCVESVTENMAVVESAIVNCESVSDRPFWELVFPGFKSQSEFPDKTESSYNWWFPNMEGLRALFRTAGFGKVETMHQTEDRGAILCYK